jgi:hypothetical protein
MRARDIVGKKVASVRQTRITDDELHGGGSVWIFDAIRFEDGTVFYVVCNESEDTGAWPEGVVIKPTRGGKRCL